MVEGETRKRKKKKKLKTRTTTGETKSLITCEKISLYQFFLQNESAYHCTSELGELDCIEFRDVSVSPLVRSTFY